MSTHRATGRRAMRSADVPTGAARPIGARRYSGRGRHREPADALELRERAQRLSEARALGAELLRQNAQAAPVPAPIAATSITSSPVAAPVPAVSRRGAAGSNLRRLFLSTLPHQGVAAVVASGLVVGTVWTEAVRAGADDQPIAPDRAATALPEAKDVVAPAATGTPALQLADVKAQAGADSMLTSFVRSLDPSATRLSRAQAQRASGLLSQPVATVRITSPFGARTDPWGSGSTVGHVGQDYGIGCGAPVMAAASGKVVQAEEAGHSGLRVTVDHGNGLQTSYNHNSSLVVKVGDHVDRGDVVSLAGSTGNSTGCHLHFEVLLHGEWVDPADWV